MTSGINNLNFGGIQPSVSGAYPTKEKDSEPSMLAISLGVLALIGIPYAGYRVMRDVSQKNKELMTQFASLKKKLHEEHQAMTQILNNSDAIIRSGGFANHTAKKSK